MCRRQQQFNELRDLCVAGAVTRAIDLAFEYFSKFGREAEIIDLLAGAVDNAGDVGRTRQRFAELCASGD